MSDLQAALIVLGVLAVAAVVIYNIWQERQFRRRSDKVLPGNDSDALLQSGQAAAVEQQARSRVEPSLQSDDIRWDESASDPAQPGDAAAVAAADAPSTVATAGESPLPATLRRRAGAASDQAGALAGPTGLWYPLVFRLPASLESAALDAIREAVAGDARIADWLDPEPAIEDSPGPASPMLDRVLRVQLVDMRGAAAATELARMLAAAQQVAARFEGQATAPDPEFSALSAAGLHEFCLSVDVSIGLNVVAKSGGFSGTKLRGLLEAAGFEAQPDHSHALRDDAGRTLCTLTDGSGGGLDPQALKAQSVRAVSLLLDVPRTPGALGQFERTAALAKQFAQALPGSVVDDSGRALDDASIARIRGQLASMVKAMRARGIEPGDALARRIFG